MTEFNSLDEYKNLIKKLSLNELLQIEQNIDRSRYPERLEVLRQMIAEKDGREPILNKEKEALYPKGITVIKRIYFIIGLLITLSICLKILSDLSFINDIKLLSALFNLFVITGIYFGIKMIKPWVVILVLLYSYLGLLFTLFELTEYSETTIKLIFDRTIALSFIIFFLYQIFLFSKKEIKDFFKATGKDII